MNKINNLYIKDNEIENILLSELFKLSRDKAHPDFIKAIDYISNRINNIQSSNSQFNKMINIIKRILPLNIIFKLLYRLRYDAIIFFYNDNNKREIFGMISFQKHPLKGKIGMFDIYVTPHYRRDSFVKNFSKFSKMVNGLILKLKKKGFKYIQCGHNRATYILLKSYKKYTEKENLNIKVDLENYRIYF